MRQRDITKNLHEKFAINDSLNLLNAHNTTNLQIIDNPNPPDAIIENDQKKSWIEHTDIFHNNDEARELWTSVTPGEHPISRTEKIIINDQEKIIIKFL